MKIAFDVDNFLADSIGCWCKRATRYLNRAVCKDDIKNPKIVGSIPMAPHDVFKLQNEVWLDWRNLPMTEPIIARKFEVLRENDFRILIVTSTPLRHRRSVKKWLALREIPFDEFHAIGVHGSKISTKADALVDDSLAEIGRFVRADKTGFLYIQPWNRDTVIKGSIRVQSIDDVLAHYNLG